MKPPIPEKKNHLFDNPRNIRWLRRALYVLCAVVMLIDLVYHRHLTFEDRVFSAEGWFGFYGISGFLAYSLIVVVGWLWRKVVMRREGYYDQ